MASGRQEQAVDWVEIAHQAWSVIANVSGGEWDEQSEDWQGAAERWRDRFLKSLATEFLRTPVVEAYGKERA